MYYIIFLMVGVWRFYINLCVHFFFFLKDCKLHHKGNSFCLQTIFLHWYLCLSGIIPVEFNICIAFRWGQLPQTNTEWNPVIAAVSPDPLWILWFPFMQVIVLYNSVLTADLLVRADYTPCGRCLRGSILCVLKFTYRCVVFIAEYLIYIIKMI